MIKGIHHITAMCSDVQSNVDFYAGILGLRLAKVTVNQDDIATYHLFFGDGEGTPGSAITFFPWPNAPRGKVGRGQVIRVAYSVPMGSLGFWGDRLADFAIKADTPTEKFGSSVLTATDPDGFVVDLVECDDPRPARPWHNIPADKAVKGFHSATLAPLRYENAKAYLQEVMGYSLQQKDGQLERFTIGEGEPHQMIDLFNDDRLEHGQGGTGTIHHIAFRVPDDATELAMREKVLGYGLGITQVIDRFWFKSLYHREPGGILYEIATDGPGFQLEKDVEASALILPPWLEAKRQEIVSGLAQFTTPQGASFPV